MWYCLWELLEAYTAEGQVHLFAFQIVFSSFEDIVIRNHVVGVKMISMNNIYNFSSRRKHPKMRPEVT